jgi:protein-S-isoprenylcysteine O-methyltransferase Ste14
LADLYSLYYYVLEGIGLALALVPQKKLEPNQKTALKWMVAAYAAIIVPTFTVTVLLPYTHLGIPSIMCGFAVIFAIILGLKVAPLALEKIS